MSFVRLPKFSEVTDIYRNEDSAIEFCQQNGILIKSGDICKHCGVGTLFAGGRKVLRYGKRNCRKKLVSVSTHQIPKAPVNQILHIGYDILAGSGATEIRIRHGLSPNTATDWC
jgi:hypothetical protein